MEKNVLLTPFQRALVEYGIFPNDEEAKAEIMHSLDTDLRLQQLSALCLHTQCKNTDEVSDVFDYVNEEGYDKEDIRTPLLPWDVPSDVESLTLSNLLSLVAPEKAYDSDENDEKYKRYEFWTKEAPKILLLGHTIFCSTHHLFVKLTQRASEFPSCISFVFDILEDLMVNLVIGEDGACCTSKDSVILGEKWRVWLGSVSESRKKRLVETGKVALLRRNRKYLVPDPYPIAFLKIDRPIEFINLDDEGLIRFAQQVTLIDYEVYNRIQPSEFLQTKWTNSLTQHFCPNIRKLTHRFNLLANWTSLIIAEGENVSVRSAAIYKFIQLGDYLKMMNNFHSLNAILSGLNMGCIRRLRESFACVDPEKMLTFKHLTELIMKKEEYFKKLDFVRPPVIPFMGHFQTDLVYIDMNDTFLGPGLINWQKINLTYKRIKLILQGQNFPYKFKMVPVLYNFCILLPGSLTSENEIEALAARRASEEASLFPDGAWSNKRRRNTRKKI